MTPQQITEQLNQIISSIADAHELIAELARDMLDDKHPELDVVYSDIWADANLSEIKKRLRIWEEQLFRFRDITLPKHFERLETPNIRTTYVHPPIPIRTADWCACVEGQEENGPYGWGATEADAIADLKERLDT
jgi:hypothetical protein